MISKINNSVISMILFSLFNVYFVPQPGCRLCFCTTLKRSAVLLCWWTPRGRAHQGL